MALATITLAELGVGVSLAKGKRRTVREDFLTDVLATIPRIDYGLEVAHAHATLLAAVRRQGRPRGAHDLVIAATAIASGREVVTADSTAFTDLPGLTVRDHRET